ncbi:hypothetical protein SAMN04489742_2543 [Arthrobacter crystallopoietes]|uniref:Uncharacterized protein n=1 Tax=Crystallibacter crystallopoietes TaxID=37928 RepID=A0A1H1DPD1_9MICC|nr:hypothetical protein SAMN04489742_2543 [Arthrobacter crystallopoietes]
MAPTPSAASELAHQAVHRWRRVAGRPCAASARERQVVHRRVPHPEVLHWWKQPAGPPCAACAPGPLAGVSSAAPRPEQQIRCHSRPFPPAARADSRPSAASSPERPPRPVSPATARQPRPVQATPRAVPPAHRGLRTGPRPDSEPAPVPPRLAQPVPQNSQPRRGLCWRRRRRRLRQTADPAASPVPADGIRPCADGAGQGQPRCSRWSSCLSPPGRSIRCSRSGQVQPRRAFISSINWGTTVKTSPTTPKSAISKIGASPSLLMATIVLAVCMPERC